MSNRLNSKRPFNKAVSQLHGRHYKIPILLFGDSFSQDVWHRILHRTWETLSALIMTSNFLLNAAQADRLRKCSNLLRERKLEAIYLSELTLGEREREKERIVKVFRLIVSRIHFRWILYGRQILVRSRNISAKVEIIQIISISYFTLLSVLASIE